MTLAKYECQPGCRCPLCDETCAAVMRMDPNTYAEYLQRTTAAMLATRPTGANYTTAMQHMSDYTTAYREVQAPEVPDPARPATSLDEVRAGVERVKREMQAEAEGRRVLRRVRNEDARVFKYLRQVPVTDGYSAALARLHGAEPEVDIYKDGPVPNGYSIALAKRGISPEVWEPTGDEPPDGYAIALAKRRKEA